MSKSKIPCEITWPGKEPNDLPSAFYGTMATYEYRIAACLLLQPAAPPASILPRACCSTNLRLMLSNCSFCRDWQSYAAHCWLEIDRDYMLTAIRVQSFHRWLFVDLVDYYAARLAHACDVETRFWQARQDAEKYY